MHAGGLNDRLGSPRGSPLSNPAGAGCGQFGLRWTLRPSRAGCTPARGVASLRDAYSKEKEVAPVIGVAGALRGATAAPRKYLLRLGLTPILFPHVSPLGIYRHLGPPITIRMPNQHRWYESALRLMEHAANRERY